MPKDTQPAISSSPAVDKPSNFSTLKDEIAASAKAGKLLREQRENEEKVKQENRLKEHDKSIKELDEKHERESEELLKSLPDLIKEKISKNQSLVITDISMSSDRTRNDESNNLAKKLVLKLRNLGLQPKIISIATDDPNKEKRGIMIPIQSLLSLVSGSH